jgi:hypothetical protein
LALNPRTPITPCTSGSSFEETIDSVPVARTISVSRDPDQNYKR